MVKLLANEPIEKNLNPEKNLSDKSLQHMWAGIRYTTPRGVGYAQGYTTVEGFFAPRNLLKDAWLPFVDVRGHVFDNGKLAANAGVGVRYLLGSRIWGGNAYYDYRNTTRQHYNQVAIGFESLGRIWDFRLNGYLPVGWKHSPLFFPRFAAFQDHSLLIRRSQQFAFSAVNAEGGFHYDHFKKAPLYFGAGPYFLTGSGQTAWGGSLRARVDLVKYLRIEANTSYDHFFKWIGQAQVSVSIPFGGRSKVIKREGHTCSQEMAFSQRMVQRIDRNEIIPVGQKQIVSRAINPATGLPWHVVFVKNTSASLGTYESPYPSLADAQNNSSDNDMIYVFGGDGTTRNMNAGITLKNGQAFLGASTAHPVATTAGTILIPAQNSTLPSITNTSGNVVTLGNNNTVAGFAITVSAGHGITGTRISNLVTDQNTLIGAVAGHDGINLTDISGNLFVTNSYFRDFSGVDLTGNAIFVTLNTATLDKFLVEGNHFIDITYTSGLGGNAISTYLNGGSLNNLTISNNLFEHFFRSRSIFTYLNNTNSVLNNFNVSNCTFDDNESQSSAILFTIFYGTLNNAKITDCYFTDQKDNSTDIKLNLQNIGILNNLIVSGNSFNNLRTDSSSIEFLSEEDQTATLGNTIISNNFFNTISGDSHGIYFNLSACSVNTLTIFGNSFTNVTDTSKGIYLATTNGGTGSLEVIDLSNNNFVSNGVTSNGWATSVEINQGTTCLNFKYNNTAQGTPAAYNLIQANSGIFNLTPASDSLLNQGDFSNGGTIGSCSD